MAFSTKFAAVRDVREVAVGETLQRVPLGGVLRDAGDRGRLDRVQVLRGVSKVQLGRRLDAVHAGRTARY